MEFVENGLDKDYNVLHTHTHTLIVGNLPHKVVGYDITSCFQSAFIEVREKNGRKCRIRRLLALSLIQCQKRLQIYRVNNIGNVLQLSCVAFRLAPHYGGILVNFLLIKLAGNWHGDEPFTIYKVARCHLIAEN